MLLRFAVSGAVRRGAVVAYWQTRQGAGRAVFVVGGLPKSRIRVMMQRAFWLLSRAGPDLRPTLLGFYAIWRWGEGKDGGKAL